MKIMHRGREVEVAPKVVRLNNPFVGTGLPKEVKMKCGCIRHDNDWVVDSGSIVYVPFFCLEHGSIHYGIQFTIPGAE